MIRDVLDKIKGLVRVLPFAIKGGNDVLVQNGNGVDSGTEIAQEVSDERVAKHLLKGEVTIPVEELRYRTYLVADSSNGFEYVGNGQAVKADRPVYGLNGKIMVRQENKLICTSVLEEFERINDYGVDTYTVSIEYESVPRFKFEQFMTFIEVRMEEGKTTTGTLRFNKIPDPSNKKSKAFINEITKWCDKKYDLGRTDISRNVASISFTTYKAEGDYDNTTYTLLYPTVTSVTSNDSEIFVNVEFKTSARMVLKLDEKYYSESMARKYETKAPKNRAADVDFGTLAKTKENAKIGEHDKNSD